VSGNSILRILSCGGLEHPSRRKGGLPRGMLELVLFAECGSILSR